MRRILVLSFILSFGLSSVLTAQVTEAEDKLKARSKDTVEGWKTGGVLGVNFSQTELVNWAAGGQSSMSLNGIFSVFANYKRGKNVWDNSLDLGYGILQQEDVKYAKKTDDKVDLLSKYGRKAYKNFYYSSLLNFKTQMASGYIYPTDSTRDKVSDFFAPAYFIGAIGMDYKPDNHLSIFAAPITTKFVFVNDTILSNAGAFGVEKGKPYRGEFGGYIRAIYSKNNFQNVFLKNISFTTKLDLFSNYLENPENIVVNWETLIALKINKYINVNINTLLIYDDKIDIGKDENNNGIIEPNEMKPRIQFKELLGIGLSIKF